MSKKRRASLQDVAEQVGVTKMTVSRYLKDPELVAKKTRDKIAPVLDALGYIPNRAPAMLLNEKSRVIGVLIPSLTNAVFSEALRGIEAVTVPARYQTMLAHYSYNLEQEEQAIESLLSYNIDGLLLSESTHSKKTITTLERVGIPTVEMFDIHNPLMQAVGFDNHAAAKEMTLTMIERGYRNIVYFGARMDSRTKIRMQGYEAAMHQHKLAPRTVATDTASSFSLGAALLRETLACYPQVDGIFCTNDDLAIGAIFECQRLNIAIPGKLGIAGFHGLDVGQAMNPQLASVITPREEIGRIAAKMLLERLDSLPMEQKCIDLGFTIHIGKSI